MRPLTTEERELLDAIPEEAFVAECPSCGRIVRYVGACSELDDWDGSTYLWPCGHRAHLNPDRGGARTGVAA